MNKEELEKYKIRDYYMIPVEVVDNVFYLFEQQCKKQKEVIDKINLIIKGVACGGSEGYYMEKFSKINELIKEVQE